ncbi:MAG: DUF3990 domain-containing protein [Bifidobacteriaceae bacterium]|nr:DUF3990 domain-containing protein [Bifidobacteriaceae bacterium]
MRLGHGSNVAIDQIDLRVSKDRRDFGRGFYTTAATITLYVDGLIDTHAAIRQLAYCRANDQVSFHSRAAIARPTLLESISL